MMEIVDKFIALFFSLMIFGNAFFVRKMVGTWLFPASIFSLFWFGYTFFPLLFMFSVPVNPWSVIFIFAASLFFSLSAVFFDWRTAFKRNMLKKGADEYFNNVFLFFGFCFFSFSSIVFFILAMLDQGFSLRDMFFNIFETAAKSIELRYDETTAPSLYGKINIVFSYLSITLGGLVFGVEKSKKRRLFILILAFLPAIAAMLFQGNKGLLFLFVVLFFAGVLVVRIFNNYLYIFDRATIKISVLSLLVIVPAVVVSFLSRGLYASDDMDYIRERLTYYIASYAFSHMYAFSDWFTFFIGGRSVNDYVRQDLSWGFQTFMAFFKAMGNVREVPPGFFDEYYKYEELLQSNIYTVFRGLMMDFGIVGSMIFMLLSGIFLHYSFYCMLYYKKPVVSVAVFLFMMGYFYTTFIISIFVWNIIPVSIVLLSFILFLNKNKIQFRSVR